MGEKLIVENSISIKSPAIRVWDALVNPAQTKKYMFGCEALSDWKPGSPLLWKGSYEGNEMVFVKGIIKEIKPGKFLAYTAIDPNSGIEDKPENYLTVTYELAEGNGQTLLTVTQGDYSQVGDGEKRYQHTLAGGGWQPILEAIRNLVEAN
jgi:uncharacterized protein YndB with AHSA1/START domain